MEVIQQGEPQKGQRTPFTWTEKCRCGAVLKVSHRDVQGASQDIKGVLRESISAHIQCPTCTNKIRPDGWKYAGTGRYS